MLKIRALSLVVMSIGLLGLAACGVEAPPRAVVLRALMAYGAPLSAVQLARDTGLTRQGVRLVLQGLEGQGLVTPLGLPRSQLFCIVPAHPFAGALVEGAEGLGQQGRGRGRRSRPCRCSNRLGSGSSISCRRRATNAP